MRSFLLKLALTVIALSLALYQVDWQELKDAFGRQQPLYVWAAASAIALQIIAGGLRWHQVRNALEPTVDNPTNTTLYYYASLFFNSIMPSTVGSDVARGWLAKRSGSPINLAIYGVVIDRIISLVGLGLLVASTLPLLFPLLGMSAEWGFVAATALWVMAIGGYIALRMILNLLGGLAHVRLIGSVIRALAQIAGKHRHVMITTLLAILAHILYATSAYALATGLGINIGWVACIVLVPLVLFISNLPISLGGWGIREFGMASVLVLASVGKTEAVVLSLQLGLLTTLISITGGVIYLVLKK